MTAPIEVLEEFLDDAEHFELADGSTVDITLAGAALDILKAERAELLAALKETAQRFEELATILKDIASKETLQ